MKLVIAVVQDSDVERILDAVTESGFRATQITSAGGFLREANVTLLIGVDDHEVDEVIRLVDTHSEARRTFVNPLMPMAPVQQSHLDAEPSTAVRVGASVFVLSVRRFIRLTE